MAAVNSGSRVIRCIGNIRKEYMERDWHACNGGGDQEVVVQPTIRLYKHGGEVENYDQ